LYAKFLYEAINPATLNTALNFARWIYVPDGEELNINISKQIRRNNRVDLNIFLNSLLFLWLFTQLISVWMPITTRGAKKIGAKGTITKWNDRFVNDRGLVNALI